MVPEERQVSHRRCCCNPDGGDCYCFCIEVTGKHVQFANLSCTPVECEIDAGEPCGTVISYAVTNSYSGTFGEVGTQQVVAYEPTDDPCRCADNACAYSYSVTPTTFPRDVCFTLQGCSFPIEQETTSGEISVACVANNVACPGTAYCGCCGTGRAVIEIVYWDYVDQLQLQGACGTINVANVYESTTPRLWWTEFRLRYCWHYGATNPDPCTLTLVQIIVSGTNAVQSYGIDALTLDDCDCNNASEVHPAYPTSGKDACAPFTAGDALTLYQLAGSPPLTLVCSKCACPGT